MKRLLVALLVLQVLVASCSRRKTSQPALQSTGYGTAVVESSGSKQVATIGSTLDQPVVVQVNDAKGNGVASAVVYFAGPAGVQFDPPAALSDSGGQVNTNVTLGGMAGHYEITAYTYDKDGKRHEVKLQEIALGYRQELGEQLNQKYCARCHDPESTPERVSNYDNLTNKPRPFTDGAALNKMSDADLVAIISHGGPAISKSAEMPAFGFTLSKQDLQALVAYIRAVADPPHQAAGLVYAKN